VSKKSGLEYHYPLNFVQRDKDILLGHNYVLTYFAHIFCPRVNF